MTEDPEALLSAPSQWCCTGARAERQSWNKGKSRTAETGQSNSDKRLINKMDIISRNDCSLELLNEVLLLFSEVTLLRLFFKMTAYFPKQIMTC